MSRDHPCCPAPLRRRRRRWSSWACSPGASGRTRASISLGAGRGRSGPPDGPAGGVRDVTARPGWARSSARTAPRARSCCPRPPAAGAASSTWTTTATSTLLVVNGRPWPWSPRAATPRPSTLALFVNDGTGRFTDGSAGGGPVTRRLRHGRGRRRLRQRRLGRPVRDRGRAQHAAAQHRRAVPRRHARGGCGRRGRTSGAPAPPGSTPTTTATSICSSAATCSGRATST